MTTQKVSKLFYIQSIFSKNVGVFLQWINNHDGWKVTLGEVHRPDIMQLIYYEYGFSKTKFSDHQDRLAIDINLAKNGILQMELGDYSLLGEYWKSLEPRNYWLGDQGFDPRHFGMKKRR